MMCTRWYVTLTLDAFSSIRFGFSGHIAQMIDVFNTRKKEYKHKNVNRL